MSEKDSIHFFNIHGDSVHETKTLREQVKQLEEENFKLQRALNRMTQKIETYKMLIDLGGPVLH